MADNTTLSAAVGVGDRIRDLDRAGVKTQIVGIDINPAGAESLMAGFLPIRPYGTPTATLSNVADSVTNGTLLAANVNRLGATVYNDSSAILTLKLGATASASSFTVKLVAGAYYEVPFAYTGRIDGLWASAPGGAARITELS